MYSHHLDLNSSKLKMKCWEPLTSSTVIYVSNILALEVQSGLYKCYTYKRYNFIHVKKILLPYKNTIGKTSECYVLSVIACRLLPSLLITPL